MPIYKILIKNSFLALFTKIAVKPVLRISKSPFGRSDIEIVIRSDLNIEFHLCLIGFEFEFDCFSGITLG